MPKHRGLESLIPNELYRRKPLSSRACVARAWTSDFRQNQFRKDNAAECALLESGFNEASSRSKIFRKSSSSIQTGALVAVRRARSQLPRMRRRLAEMRPTGLSWGVPFVGSLEMLQAMIPATMGVLRRCTQTRAKMPERLESLILFHPAPMFRSGPCGGQIVDALT